MKIMRILKAVCLFAIAFLPAAGYAQDVSGFTAVLAAHVHNGSVNYKMMCADKLLNEAINRLSGMNPDKLPNDNETLAFWINAYNAYTLKAVCDHYPVKSILDLNAGGLILGSIAKTTIWDRDFALINGSTTTLNHIEHKIIRPQFHEPRAHFALVCASKSCPPLRPEAYDGKMLTQQLDDQARIFLSDSSRNRFDLKNRKAYLSKIFDWYGKDFGANQKERLVFVSRFASEPLKSSLQNTTAPWQVEFLDYDWSLNDTKSSNKD